MLKTYLVKIVGCKEREVKADEILFDVDVVAAQFTIDDEVVFACTDFQYIQLKQEVEE